MLVATETFKGGLGDGTDFDAVKGQTRVWADHPAVKRWPQHFRAISVTFETPGSPEFESATAAPGEKRGA